MQLQLWRNATLLLMIRGQMILVDPMLGPKGSLGRFPWTDDQRDNPLTDLPFSAETLAHHLDLTDVVAITHLHPDHMDETAIQLLLERQPLIICPTCIAEPLASHGFKNIAGITQAMQWNEITITITGGRHGYGEIGKLMGPVNGFVFESPEGTLYLAGDTVWCEEVESALRLFQPDHVIVAGGAAQFAIGDPATMTSGDIRNVCKNAPNSLVWVTHLETIAPCREDRASIRRQIALHGLSKSCFVLEDGQTVFLKSSANNSPSFSDSQPA